MASAPAGGVGVNVGTASGEVAVAVTEPGAADVTAAPTGGAVALTGVEVPAVPTGGIVAVAATAPPGSRVALAVRGGVEVVPVAPTGGVVALTGAAVPAVPAEVAIAGAGVTAVLSSFIAFSAEAIYFD